MVDTIGPRPKQFSNLSNNNTIAEVGSPLVVDNDGRNNYGPPTPVIPQIADGRLSLDSTDSTPTDDLDDASATTIYYVPYVGEMISLWNGAEWRYYDFSIVPSLVLDGSDDTDGNSIVVDHVYDILIRYGGTAELELVAVDFDNHSAGTGARQSGKGLIRQNGVLVWENDRTYRYLGTIRTIDNGGTVVCESTERRRFLWNLYNRVRTSNHNSGYSSWNVFTAHQSTLAEWGKPPVDPPRFDYVVGIAELDPIEFSCGSGISQSYIVTSPKRCGFGIHISMNTTSNIANDSIGAHVRMEVASVQENPDSAFLWAEFIGYNRASGTGSIAPGYGYIRLLWGTGGDSLSSDAQITYNSTSTPQNNKNGRLCNFWY